MSTATQKEITKAQERALIHDTLILQKVNASHRIAFTEKYPGTIEHILRLLTERLQLGLDKRDNVDIADVHTWKLLPSEIHDLADAIYKIHEVRKDLLSVKPRNLNE
jgi:hypothetical protein